jgi:transcriptional regulator with XRE-family HTH domain
MYNKIFLENTYDMKNKVGEYRYKQNITLKELSQRSGISTTTLSKIENDQTNDILLSHAITLSHILKVDLYELFCIKR